MKWFGFICVSLVVAACGSSSDCVDGRCEEELPEREEPCGAALAAPADSCSWAIGEAMDAARSGEVAFGFRQGDQVTATESGSVSALFGNEVQIDLPNRVVVYAWPRAELPIAFAVGDPVELETLDGWAVVRGPSGELRVPDAPGAFSFHPGPWSVGDQLQVRQIAGSCWSGGAVEVVVEVESDMGKVELHPGQYYGRNGWTVRNDGAGSYPPIESCGTVTEGRYFGGFSAWREG